jgi:hypothetical protein
MGSPRCIGAAKKIPQDWGIRRLMTAIYTLVGSEECSQTKFNYFLSHLKAEYPALKSSVLEDIVVLHPYELIEILRLLTLRKHFKGTCEVCESWYKDKAGMGKGNGEEAVEQGEGEGLLPTEPPY